jgi:hypothetical protein
MSKMMENGLTVNSVGGVVSYKYDTTPLPMTPCLMQIGSITSATLGYGHVHLGTDNQDATKICRLDFPGRVMVEGPSPDDWNTQKKLQAQFPTVVGFVIGQNLITVYWVQKTPSGEWEQHTDTYPRCGY